LNFTIGVNNSHPSQGHAMTDTRFARMVQAARQFHERVFPEYGHDFARLTRGQDPAALFITCADSRVSPEMITDAAPGDLFVCRNIGNLVPGYGEMLGGVSAVVEFAVNMLHVPHIIICGHSDCGAMKAMCDPVTAGLDTMPTVKSWLRNAEAALSVVRATAGDLSEGELLATLIRQNVALQLQHLRTHPAVAAALASGRISLHGWIFDIGAGRIDSLDETAGTQVPLSGSD
jgi:carbonic anhydrase